MPWVVKHDKKHACSPPTFAGSPRDIWVCDTCGTGYKGVPSLSDRRKLGYWQKMFHWRTSMVVNREIRRERRVLKSKGL